MDRVARVRQEATRISVGASLISFAVFMVSSAVSAALALRGRRRLLGQAQQGDLGRESAGVRVVRGRA